MVLIPHFFRQPVGFLTSGVQLRAGCSGVDWKARPVRKIDGGGKAGPDGTMADISWLVRGRTSAL